MMISKKLLFSFLFFLVAAIPIVKVTAAEEDKKRKKAPGAWELERAIRSNDLTKLREVLITYFPRDDEKPPGELSYNEQVERSKMLPNVDINGKDDVGDTPLITAIECCDPCWNREQMYMIRTLIEYRANIEQKLVDRGKLSGEKLRDTTPLDFAKHTERHNVVQLLQENGVYE